MASRKYTKLIMNGVKNESIYIIQYCKVVLLIRYVIAFSVSRNVSSILRSVWKQMLFSFPSDLMTKYFLFLMSNEIFLRLTGTLPGVECELINGEAAVARLALQVDPEVPVCVDGDLTNQRRLTRSRDQLSTNHSSPGPSRRHSRCAGSPWGRTDTGCSRGQSWCPSARTRSCRSRGPSLLADNWNIFSENTKYFSPPLPHLQYPVLAWHCWLTAPVGWQPHSLQPAAEKP